MDKVKIIFTDFDGVWTDNCVYVSEEGVESVKCSKLDSMGLKRFRALCDVKVIVISSETNRTVSERCKKLNIECIASVEDKVEVAKQLCQRENLDLSRDAMYVGNDVNDIAILKEVKFSAVVSDASDEVVRFSKYICKNSGGCGAIREVLDEVLRCKKLL